MIQVIPVDKGKHHNSKSTKITLVLRVNNWAFFGGNWGFVLALQNPFICCFGWSHCCWRKKRWYMWSLCENNWFTFGMHPKGTHFTEIKENPIFTFHKLGEIKAKSDERQGKNRWAPAKMSDHAPHKIFLGHFQYSWRKVTMKFMMRDLSLSSLWANHKGMF